MQTTTWQYQCKRMLCAAAAAGFIITSVGVAQAVPVPAATPGMPALLELADAGQVMKSNMRINNRFAPGEKRADDSLEVLQRLQQRGPAGNNRSNIK